MPASNQPIDKCGSANCSKCFSIPGADVGAAKVKVGEEATDAAAKDICPVADVDATEAERLEG